MNGLIVEQWGTTGWDGVHTVIVGASNEPVVGGAVGGAIDGQPFVGQDDAFVSARPSNAAARWTRTNGTTGYDQVIGLALNVNGQLFEVGSSNAQLGSTALGGDDLVLIQRAVDHSVTKISQWGASSDDTPYGFARDKNGDFYVCGATSSDFEGKNAGGYDAFVSKISPSGTVAWTSQWGTAYDDIATSLTVDDAGNVYVTGAHRLQAGGAARDVFAAQLNATGTLQWQTPWHSPVDAIGRGIVMLSTGKLMVVGGAGGSMGATGSGGVFVSIVSAAGQVSSTEQFGNSYFDAAYAVVHGAGTDLYITGTFDGSNVQGANPNTDDAFVQKRSETGVVAWTKQFGTPDSERAEAVAVAADGTVYVGGFTGGSFPGYTNAGGQDAFLATVSP